MAEVKWYEIQEKVFTRWCNDYLSKRDPPVEISSFKTDLQNGIKLILLIEAISGRKEVCRYNKKPTTKFHKMENLNNALNFLKSEGIKLVNVGATDIFDSNITIILGLIWTLILRYEIKSKQGEAGDDATNDLLKWVREQIPEYDIKNFGSNWNDGRAVCALTNAMLPGLIPDHFSKDPNEALENATQGIDIAWERLKIDKLLLPEEMVHPKVDRLSMMTYIAQFRNISPDDMKTDASLCRAYGDGLVKGVVGQESQFFVEMDPSVKSQPVVSVRGPSGDIALKKSMTEEGHHAFSYVPEVPGAYATTVTVGGLHVKGSVFQATVLDKDAARCRAYGPGLEGGVVQETGKFTVEIPADLDAGKLEIKVLGPTDEAKATVTKDASGKYQVEYNPTTPGAYEVHVTIGGDHVPGSIFRLQIAERPAARCKAYGRGLTEAVVKDVAEFTVEVPTDLPKKAEVRMTGPDGTSVPINQVQQEEGKTLCSYVAQAPGPHEIAITYDGEHIPRSTFHLNVQKKSAASRTRAYGPGLEGGTVGDQCKYFVEVPSDEPDHKLVTKVTGPDGTEVPCEVKNVGVGRYEVVYEPKDAGDHKIEVAVNEEQVPGSIFKVPIEQKSDALRCSAYGPGLGDGLFVDFETYFCIKHPRDVSLDNGKLAIKIWGNDEKEVSEMNFGPSKDLPNEWKVTYTPELIGEYTIFVRVNQENIPGSPFKAHVRGPLGKTQVYFTTTSSSAKVRADIEHLENLFYIKKVFLRPDFEPWIAMDMIPKADRDAVYEDAGCRTLPLVFIDDKFIGSWDTIEDLNDCGELDQLLRLDTVHLLTLEQHMQRLIGMDEEKETAGRTHFCGSCGCTKLIDNSLCPDCGETNPLPFTPENLAKRVRFIKVAAAPDRTTTKVGTGKKWTPPPKPVYTPPEEKRSQWVKKAGEAYTRDEVFAECYAGNIDAVREMLKQGMSPNMRDDQGFTPWMAALENKQDSLCALLVEYGAEYDQDDFFVAVYNDQLEVVQAMVKKGQNVNVIDEEGSSPLGIAIQEEHGRIVRFLRTKGAKVPGEAGFPPAVPPKPANIELDDFFIAVAEGKVEDVRNFIAWGADVNQADEDGTTLVHIATINDHTEVVNMLIAAGAKND